MMDDHIEMGAVSLRVLDLQKTADFYQRVIGLELIEKTTAAVCLGSTAGPLVHLQHLPDGRPVRFATGLYHLALRVPTRRDLANWFGHYGAQDAPFWQGASDHGVSEALYLSDPEGNGIEIYYDRPRAEWPVGLDGKLTMFTAALDLRSLQGAADGRSWQGIAPETDMGHVHLKVADIVTARRFYVDILGFDTIVELPQSALFVSAGGYHHHLGLNVWHSRLADPLPDDGLGLVRYEIRFPSNAARDEVARKLERAQAVVVRHAGTIYLTDPFGIDIALTLS
ncbi:MAG: VOC family protein [Candidatus Promineifilaceae bacterium]|nr:VOC family protein [Candidatus Promineifilaceae bacterium]